MTVTIHTGDSAEVLKLLPDCSVTAVVTDPPAGISFMNKSWDSDKGGPRQWIAWLTDIMAECLRVLVPGGHALVWSLPRTSHWTGTALELAGFEVRDMICHIFGTGFPKNHDVSKAIDKLNGAERQVVGSKAVTRDISGGSWSDLHGSALTATTVDVTAPATPDAEKWQGYGTALKPSHEVWWLARKPMAGSVAQNVLEHGAGAINIDGCRVSGGERLHIDATARVTPSQFGAMGGSKAIGTTTEGRWPPNLLLSHHPECRQIGTAEVEGDSKPAGRLHGSQTVPVMSCHTDCPVAELDRQSGATSSVRSTGRNGADDAKSTWSLNRSEDTERGHTDTGGASRYFPIFRYQAKATTAERDHGVTGPARQTGFPMRSAEQDSNAEGGDGTKTHRQTSRKNLHPTVKSVALMRWLVTLVSSPEGTVVLDPFCGSGSTGVACVINGVDFVGIEQSAEFADVARQRCAQAQRDNGVTAEDIRAGNAPAGPVQVKLW